MPSMFLQITESSLHQEWIQPTSTEKGHSTSWRHKSEIFYLFDGYHKDEDHSWTLFWLQWWGLLYGNKDSGSAFICPCHLFISNGDYIYYTSTTVTGPETSVKPCHRECIMADGKQLKSEQSVMRHWECFQLSMYAAISPAEYVVRWITVTCDTSCRRPWKPFFKYYQLILEKEIFLRYWFWHIKLIPTLCYHCEISHNAIIVWNYKILPWQPESLYSPVVVSVSCSVTGHATSVLVWTTWFPTVLMTCAHTVTGPNTEEGWVYYLFLIPDHLDFIADHCDLSKYSTGGGRILTD